jgi:WD40 repeat protein
MKPNVVLLTLVLACLPLSTSTPVAAPNFSDWGSPTNLGPIVNSPFLDGGPALSKNGLSLYIHSDRPAGFGGTDIWVSQRVSTDDPWGPPVNLGPVINSSSAETVPSFSRDEHWMFFASTRNGGQGGNDIWASWRPRVHDDFGWQPPVNLSAINTASFDAGPAYFAGDGPFPPTLFFVSARPGGFGIDDIYFSEIAADGSFGALVRIPELSSPADDSRVTVRHDGLEILFFSNRPNGAGLYDLWSSTRATLGSTWEVPLNLGSIVNSAFNEFQPQLSSDGRMLLFASDRPVGSGGFDLYISVRSKPGR